MIASFLLAWRTLVRGRFVPVLFAAGAYIRAKREVKDSMHNVAEAQDADDFIEEGNLSLSFSGNKKGPRQEQDNWPV